MSAKTKDTTKTAHVMNLLKKNTGSTQTADLVEDKQKEVPVQGETVAAVPKSPMAQHPIIASLNEEASVSQEIKDALVLELEEVLSSAEAEPEPAVPQQAQEITEELPETQVNYEEDYPEEDLSEEEDDEEFFEAEFPKAEDYEAELSETETPEAETPETKMPEAEVCEEEISVQPEADAAPPVAESTETQNSKTEVELKICNVMQVLVEDYAEKYMSMFKLCCCPRCKADVQAIALNNLQPKYVVMQPGEYIPRLTVYEKQLNTAVTAQILRACNIVMESPRH